MTKQPRGAVAAASQSSTVDHCRGKVLREVARKISKSRRCRRDQMRRRLVAVLVIVAAVSYACADDDEVVEGGAETSTTSDVGGRGVAADGQTLAEAVVLKDTDLPEDVEWSTTPWEPDAEGEAALRRCAGLPPKTDIARADSPTFSAGDVTRVDSSASVTSSVESMNEQFAVTQAEKFVDCVRERLEAQLQQQDGTAFGPVHAERLDFPAVGDGATAVRISTTVEAEDGQEVPLYVDLVVFKRGRVGMTITLMNAPEPFPAELAVRMAHAMAARADDAPTG